MGLMAGLSNLGEVVQLHEDTRIQGYYGGKTWAGATPPYRATALAAAASVAPAQVSPKTKGSTVRTDGVPIQAASAA
jgi:hypothetical protein